ncbi:putative POU domain class 2-associating factor 1 [Apostichopus japonicus]|uniref:Putative POU domain class 2-associating factor 1 n=1 Tax=Stichopus japonicus TaxID=307972 RepID=A0A2G8LKM5_STIJA|nr:putative POU domain class 2-associating factor 1 [Apostichopus japonicus]
MPSIESLYLTNEKAVDRCTENSHESTKSSIDDISSAILKKKVKELDEKMEALKEAVEVNELEGPGDCDTVVIVKIENPEESEEQEENGSLSKRREDEADVQESGVEKEEEEPEKLEDIKKNGANTSKQTNEKWDNIWDKICPDIDQAKNKLLKKKVCALLAKCVPKGEDLCKKLEGMSLGGDKNGLKAKGPGDHVPQCRHVPTVLTGLLHSPGQMTTLSSPPHEGVLPSFAILQNDMKVNSGATDMYQWNLGNNYHSVSPPNMSYQSDHSISDVECNMNHVSPQSLDDGPQDIPTVMAQAMYLIVPGDSQPTVCNQDLVNQWDSPSASTSSQHQASGIDGRTDYDVQTWPGMDLHPLPVSMATHRVSAPSPMWTLSLVLPVRTIIQRCHQPPSLGGQFTRRRPHLFVFPVVSTTDQCASGIGEYNAGDKLQRNPLRETLKCHVTEELHRDWSSTSCHPQPITITESPPLYSPPREENAVQTSGYEQSIHQRNAFRLSADELLQRDCSDPYEGENILQKLILHQKSEQAIAVIQRMVQLRLDLNATNDQGQSSLLLAVINGMAMVVRYLVAFNADVLNGDKKGTYPIHYAASHGFTEVIDAICASNRHVDLECLDFNGKTPLMCAVETHGTTQTIYQDGEEVGKVVNNLRIAQILLENGAQPTKQDARSGKTALHYAIADVKLDMIKLILDSDEMVKVARVPMSDGNTPLHLAVALKCNQSVKCDIIKYLIHKGADISATNVERVKPLDLVTARSQRGLSGTVLQEQEKINVHREKHRSGDGRQTQQQIGQKVMSVSIFQPIGQIMQNGNETFVVAMADC